MNPSKAGSPDWSPQQRRSMRRLGIGIMVAAAIMVIGSLVLIVQGLTASRQLTPPDATTDRSGIAVFAGSAPTSAPTVQVYLDYQCPDCAEIQRLYGPSLTEMAKAKTIQLSYHALTVYDQKLGNDSSVRAARAAACADVVGSFSAYQDAVFAAQPDAPADGFSAQVLRDTIPDDLGMTGGARSTFGICYDQAMTSDFVTAAAQANDPVEAPRILVNAKPLTLKRGATPAEFQAAIEQAAR